MILSTTWLRHLAAASSVLLISVPLHAEPEADPTAKLMDQLRSVTLQLRTAQTESANAKVAQTAAEQLVATSEKSIKDLKAANERLTKKASEEKTAADEAMAVLNGKVTERDEALVRYNEALEKWKVGYEKAAAVAREKEEARAGLASEVVMNKREIADLQRKNVSLFNVSNEILDRYEGYALGKAIAAKEPFIGTTRVKIENLVQGYKDRIVDNRIAAPAKP
ncbi:MAG: phage major capsid protein [Verrucomicrobiota bacterium]